jgi:hypothetical protein
MKSFFIIKLTKTQVGEGGSNWEGCKVVHTVQEFNVFWR